MRGHGLFIGVEMVKAGGTARRTWTARSRSINRLKDKGFLTSNAGAFGNVVKIRPPLVFAHENADEFLTAFDATIAEIDGMTAAAAQAFTPAARAGARGVRRSTPAELRFVSLSENVTFKVTDAHDGPCCAAAAPPRVPHIAALRSEHVWTRALAEAGVAVPNRC